ncbi:hypothetical protein VOLCADRAFT_106113 [Volvox carteri f. nagariensis]|uniref:Uncharacterized protein n=1 Tax=Volvox carteri f. nagariensis TaxID=3068 RepID=D8U560_VOLCA|nr:uncharacterized protein VOLCADRAFT_106113 [Volvox carteri f. nagariensis]EFJ45159.1 hypothetical protein VOLCADRAFT_106113 [Volvox carteri f. nagariensis]|eukprot:XP_002953835.1 hypothetical protein VOLCADRAFT_106113 [Volvox carteri f. nagariensis]
MATPAASSGTGGISGGASRSSGRRGSLARTSGATDNNNSTLVQHARATTVVAIDVGTYGSGFAYVISRPGESSRTVVHTDWPDRPNGAAAAATGGTAGGSDRSATATGAVVQDRYPKTRSALLLRAGKGSAFGWTAVRKYCDMDEQERTEGRYHLVYGTEFKLGLEDRSRAAALPAGHLQQQATKGSLGSASASASASAASAARGMVRWCLTVPAMWSDGAKAAVRRAAHRAALITSLDSDELTVVLEPEAAALQLSIGADRPLLFPAAITSPLAAAASARAAPLPTTLVTASIAVGSGGSGTSAATGYGAKGADGSVGVGVGVGSAATGALRAGEIFMVVDAGGGTVDITVHEVIERGGTAVLSEAQAVPGWGAMWGATALDEAFKAHFRSKAKDLAPAGVRAEGDGNEDGGEEVDDWEGGGGGLGRWGGRDTWRVPIPPTLHAAMDAGVKADLLMEYGLDDSVVLDRQTLARLFRDPVYGVTQAANRQLDVLAAAPNAPAARCSKVILAGGFGCSRYLESQLAAAVGGRLAPGGGVLVPERAAAAVLQGAALYGMKPELVRARSSRLTYGLVEVDEVVTHVFTPLSPDQQIASVELWATDQQTVRWIEAEDIAAESARGRRGAAEAGALGGGGGGGSGDDGDNGGSTTGMRRVGNLERRMDTNHADRDHVRMCRVVVIGGITFTSLVRGQVLLLRDDPLPTATHVAVSGAAAAASVRVGDRGDGIGTGGSGSSDGEEPEERLIEVSLEFGRTEIRVTARDMLTGRRYSTRVKFAYSW